MSKSGSCLRPTNNCLPESNKIAKGILLQGAFFYEWNSNRSDGTRFPLLKGRGSELFRTGKTPVPTGNL